MSRIKNFFAGQVTFTVDNLPINCLNHLRQYQICNIQSQGTKLIFSAPLIYATKIKKLISNFDGEIKHHANLWQGINYLLNHSVLMIAIVVALALFFVADLSIYDVKVVSPDQQLNQIVTQHLSGQGIKKFTFKRKIQQSKIADELVTSFPTIAHANVKISGNTLLINLSPATYQTKKNKINIYAKHDAVVKSVTAYSGQPMVTIGDVVKRGDLLVENAYEDSVVVIGEVAFVNGDQIIRLDIVIV